MHQNARYREQRYHEPSPEIEIVGNRVRCSRGSSHSVSLITQATYSTPNKPLQEFHHKNNVDRMVDAIGEIHRTPGRATRNGRRKLRPTEAAVV